LTRIQRKHNPAINQLLNHSLFSKKPNSGKKTSRTEKPVSLFSQKNQLPDNKKEKKYH